MRSLKRIGTLMVVVFALGATGATSASAAEFTASATGELSAKALTYQAWTFTGYSGLPNNQYRCESTTVHGKIEKTALTSLHMGMFHNLCTIFGFTTTGSPGFTYVFHANGTVDIANTIKIPFSFGGCNIVIEPQAALGSVTWDNNGGKLVQTINLSGVTYTSTGLACGPSGTNGTFTGTNEISRAGSGSLTFDS